MIETPENERYTKHVAVTLPFHHRIAEIAAADGERTALIAEDGRRWTYASLLKTVHELVARWQSLQLDSSDCVVSVLPDGPEAIFAFLSVTAVASWAPLNPAGTRGEFSAAFDRLQPKMLLVHQADSSVACDLARESGIPVLVLDLDSVKRDSSPTVEPNGDENQVALLLFTSGTHGRPKIVPLSHRNLFHAAGAICETLELGPSDRTLSVMPLFHIHGLSAVMASLLSGGSAACINTFDASRFWDWLRNLQPTWYTSSPTHHQAILDVAEPHVHELRNSPLRLLRSASAPMPTRLIGRLEEVFQVPFLEAYGMTEAGPIIAGNRYSSRVRPAGSVGHPVGASVQILDESNLPASPGMVGEIVIQGPNVIERYWHDPEADRDSFVNGALRTGDLGYLNADGELFVTGRRKEIINRGGEKICPREVEEAVLAHSSVREAACFGVPHPRLGEDVALAVVLKAGSQTLPGDFREFLSERLAVFKIPQRIVVLESIPRRHGKLRRLELHQVLAAELGHAEAASHDSLDRPATEIEQHVLRAFAAALDCKTFDIHQNFFMAGGESLLAAEVAQELGRSLHVEISFHEIFLAPTPAELAARVENRLRGQNFTPADRMMSMPSADRSFLSPIEEGLWLVDQRHPGHPAYNVYRTIRIRGHVNPENLECAIQVVVNRHENLRTGFSTHDGRPMRFVVPAAHVPFVRTDLSDEPDAGRRQQRAQQLAVEFAQQPFCLSEAPLFRSGCLTLSESESWLMLATHHIVVDRWSMTQIVREIFHLHDQIRRGEAAELPLQTLQMADWVGWQRRREHTTDFQRQLAYWRTHLSDMPPDFVWPKNRPVSSREETAGQRLPLQFDVAATRAIKEFSRQEGVTPYVVLLTAFQCWLAKFTHQTDLIVGTPVVGRWQPEAANIIGCINNTLVIRTQLEPADSFHAALQRVRRSVTTAFEHPDVPLMTIRQNLPPLSRLGRTGLFQVNFRLQTAPLPESAATDLSFELVEIDNGFAKFDLSVELWEKPGGFGGHLEYRAMLFAEADVVHLAREFVERVISWMRDPAQRVLPESPPIVAATVPAEAAGSRLSLGQVRRAGKLVVPTAAQPSEFSTESR